MSKESLNYILERANELLSDMQKDTFNATAYQGALNAITAQTETPETDRILEELCIIQLI